MGPVHTTTAGDLILVATDPRRRGLLEPQRELCLLWRERLTKNINCLLDLRIIPACQIGLLIR